MLILYTLANTFRARWFCRLLTKNFGLSGIQTMEMATRRAGTAEMMAKMRHELKLSASLVCNSIETFLA